MKKEKLKKGALCFLAVALILPPISVLGYHGCTPTYNYLRNFCKKENPAQPHIVTAASTLNAISENQQAQSSLEDKKGLRISPDELIVYGAAHKQSENRIIAEIKPNKLENNQVEIVYTFNPHQVSGYTYSVLCYKVKTHRLTGFRLEIDSPSKETCRPYKEELSPGKDLEYLVETDLEKLALTPLDCVTKIKWVIDAENFTWPGPKFEISDIYLKNPKPRNIK